MTADIERRIREFASERHLDDRHLELWLQIHAEEALEVLEIARTLNLRSGQLASALELLDEIAARGQGSPTDILGRDDIRRAIARSGSRPTRAAALISALRAIRFPRLTELRARIDREIAAMELPRTVTVVIPENLATAELGLELTLGTIADLDAILTALSGKRADIQRIIAMLSGADET